MNRCEHAALFVFLGVVSLSACGSDGQDSGGGSVGGSGQGGAAGGSAGGAAHGAQGGAGMTPAGGGTGTGGGGSGGEWGAGGSGPRPVDIALVKFVDPLIGTASALSSGAVAGGSGGSVFPGAAAPFGMVQWSPDTPKGEPSGYNHTDATITGFSLTHFSGAGCANNGDIPVLPFASGAGGPVGFTHATEHAAAGSYDVTLDDGTRVELTATARAGVGRFSYRAGGGRKLLVDLTRNAVSKGVPNAVTVGPGGSLTGYTTGGHFCGAGNVYKLYFAITFDQTVTVSSNEGGRLVLDVGGEGPVEMKVGLSFVGTEGAAANLGAEVGSKGYDDVTAATRASWNARLNAVQVTGGSNDDATKFYTALYHAMLAPNVNNDVSGAYLGFDKKAYQAAAGHSHYANYSGWDIYRSEIQLLSLLFPTDASDMAQSLVDDAAQCGAFPRWSQNNADAGVMVGDPGSLIVASAYAFGARGFDTARALATMRASGDDPQAACDGDVTLPGVAEYLALGYLPSDAVWGGASTTLEYASRDAAVAAFAAALGDDDARRTFAARSAFWRNVFDDKGYVEPRALDGQWKSPVNGPGEGYNVDYVEGNAEQYSWMVPHDAGALVTRLGGAAKVVPRLDAFFAKLNAGGDQPNFYMGNEPNFATPWLYNWAGAPAHTQAVTRRIVSEVFTTGPAGLPGNDDLGATSSWLVWAMLGLYPVVPGVGGLTVGSPVFPDALVRIGDAAALHLVAHGAPATYVQSVTLDNHALDSPWVEFASIAHGAEMGLTLGASASPWGSAPENAPPSFGPGQFSSVADAANRHGISDDSAPELVGFDGLGFSYSSQALAAAGLAPGTSFDAEGLSLAWPAAAPGHANVVTCVGQSLAFATPIKAAKVAFVGAASNGPATGTGTLHYADGSSAAFPLTLTDWTRQGGAGPIAPGNAIVATTPYRDLHGGAHDATPTYVFSTSVALDPAKALARVELPARTDRGLLHVFAVAAH